ncbi:hypothetical protein CTAYLR_002151 [Chrysophaeum taylorii]|uniref:Pirin family protein n=1 Tax=Chrysophaeum taylorii TaxID=2483200 RepID=A0AAD7UPV5_9STRA|nr:hypothetical protein CTAYLR_002151 [Chrysophaeum taylorii]
MRFFAAAAWTTVLLAARRSWGFSGGLGRRVARVENPERLPVWPVANGLVACVLDLLKLEDAAALLEEKFGGRVCPMMLEPEADPFVLLVHHRHAFDFWDPVRPLFRLLMPEGFPAHPHVGFETVTATVAGGLSHRDSVGVVERYHDGDVQWLTAGRGVLHEEMWIHPEGRDCELYQLWVNLGRDNKRATPRTEILRGSDLEVAAPSPGVLETRLGGDLGGASAETTGARRNDVRLSRVEIDPAARFRLDLAADATALVYVRRGHVHVADTLVPRYRLAYTRRESDAIVVENRDPDLGAEILLLCATPLREPVFASGTWVVSSEQELDAADEAYEKGWFGVPWRSSLSDDEWRAWVQRHPPRV